MNGPMTDELLEKAERNILSAKFRVMFGGTVMVGRNTLEEIERIIVEVRRLKQERDELLTLLEKALVGAKHESCLRTSGLIDDPDPTWHCCDWTELVKEIEEVLKKKRKESVGND